MKLLQDGKVLCDVSNYSFHRGQQHFERIDALGGESAVVPTHQDPDWCSFTVPRGSLPNIQSQHELQDDKGAKATVHITKIQTSGGDSMVIAFIG